VEPNDGKELQKYCTQWLSSQIHDKKTLFTKSCTQSLEVAIMALNLPARSEIIIPSYGFVSLANAVAICGHHCVFVDCDAETLNISFNEICNAVSDSTRAIIAINYGGVPCDYDSLIPFCEERDIILIEDNAHGLLASYNRRSLGTFGHVSTFSFDSLKMITCYEGGAITSRDTTIWQRIRIAHEIGTDRHDFLEGKVPFYEWKSLGTNANLAPPLFAYLKTQFEIAEKIKTSFVNAWNKYEHDLDSVLSAYDVTHSFRPKGLDHNGYIFWVMARNEEERMNLQHFMSKRNITLNPHYSALHRSEFGRQYHASGRPLPNTERAVACMLRLPLFYGISKDDQNRVIEGIRSFYQLLQA
jgi:dTDP-4-amino-4,6-dideoxygalactose transaminase